MTLPRLALAAIVAAVAAWPPCAGAATPSRDFHFENDILPVLGRHGCNSSGCHGKAEGQGGFKLSVFASDPEADYAALVNEGRGRRVFAPAPEQSLLLRKAVGRVPHGGGVRFEPRGEDYDTVRDWVAAGMPFGSSDAPRLVALRVEPNDRVMGMNVELPLRIVARYGDGHEKDVTRHARFQSNNEAVVGVSAHGVVRTRDVPGEAAVMAAYLGEVCAFQTVVPRPASADAASAKRPQFNFVDAAIDRKLAKLNVTPSGLCDDATFLRRAFLDLAGTLPAPAEARAFLADRTADRRARLVDDLLARPEYADFWAMRWADLLRVDRQVLGHQKAYAYYRWIRHSVAENEPFDRFARELVTAEGPLPEAGPANFYRVAAKPGDMASTLSQVFLGVRIACAECHHHPFDRWTQTDYYGMVAYFSPVVVRGQGESVGTAGEAVAKHPRTGARVEAHPLGAAVDPTAGSGDARLALAEWMTKPDNPYFARNLANRVWAHLLGRGLVEPVDDVRGTNPPSNPELLDALARFVSEHGYDVKALIRVVAASRTYQTATEPNGTNATDERNFSRALFKRPDAEVLLDAICRATGVGETFTGSPGVTRSVQLWDSRAKHDFLRRFGRPARATACECERAREPSVAQVLTMLNSAELQGKLSHEAGTVARLARTLPDDAKLTEELYLTFFARYPTGGERAASVAHLARDPKTRRQAAEDIAWAMLNATEFLFNH